MLVSKAVSVVSDRIVENRGDYEVIFSTTSNLINAVSTVPIM